MVVVGDGRGHGFTTGMQLAVLSASWGRLRMGDVAVAAAAELHEVWPCAVLRLQVRARGRDRQQCSWWPPRSPLLVPRQQPTAPLWLRTGERHDTMRALDTACMC